MVNFASDCCQIEAVEFICDSRQRILLSTLYSDFETTVLRLLARLQSFSHASCEKQRETKSPGYCLATTVSFKHVDRETSKESSKRVNEVRETIDRGRRE